MEMTDELVEEKVQTAAYDQVVTDLAILLDSDPEMKAALLASLNVAVARAKKDLNADLYAAIDRVFYGNGWPTTIEAYYHYLNIYVRLVPNEEKDPMYPNAWKSDGTKNGYNQKVYDLLCQFYWLIDQGVNGVTMQSFPDFADWLVEFANAWGSFLDKPESLTPESLFSFMYDTMYNFPLYAKDKPNWHSFNEFFYRQFNDADPATGITPLRPIAAPDDNKTIVAAADCTYQETYGIDDAGNVVDNMGAFTKLKLKQTHTIGTVSELLDGSPYAKDFYGGTFVHYFLSPFDYHRFHTPISGKILEIRPVQGLVYLNVVLTSDGQWDAPDGAENGYEFKQARGIVIIDGGADVGKIAAIPVGMCQVSGVLMYNDQLKVGDEVVKGQEFGKFCFGGSDIILLFEKAPDLYLYKNDPSHVPIHFQYGQTVAYWNEGAHQ